MVTVEATDELAGPELPEGVLPPGETWHEQTRVLWNELRQSPLMRDESSLTWRFLVDTAALHSKMWHGRWDLASEVRLRLGKIGCTPEDRQRLRIRVTQPAPQAPEVPAGVADMAARRARLTE
jgi:hypothetical protein